MKVESSTVEKLRLTDLDSLDTVAVIAEDLGPGQGKVTITCYGKSWSAYWNAMGPRSIAKFFCGCDNQYLAGNLSCAATREVDYEEISRAIGVQVERETVLLYEAALIAIYGRDWMMDLPQRDSYDYVYLCKVIDAVKEAFRLKLQGEAA